MIVLAFLATFATAGYAVGVAAARLPWLDGRWARALAVPTAVTAITQGVFLAAAALTYTGNCSGFGDSGSYPCALGDHLTRQLGLGLFFSFVPTITAIALAFVVCSSRRSRRSASADGP